MHMHDTTNVDDSKSHPLNYLIKRHKLPCPPIFIHVHIDCLAVLPSTLSSCNVDLRIPFSTRDYIVTFVCLCAHTHADTHINIHVLTYLVFARWLSTFARDMILCSRLMYAFEPTCG